MSQYSSMLLEGRMYYDAGGATTITIQLETTSDPCLASWDHTAIDQGNINLGSPSFKSTSAKTPLRFVRVKLEATSSTAGAVTLSVEGISG